MPATTSVARKPPTMRALKTTLRSLLNMFQDICEFAERLSVVTSASQVTVRLEKLDELWEKINDTILEIKTHEEFTEEEDLYSKQQSDFSSRYYDIKSLLLDKIKELEEPAILNQSARSLDTSQLPTIEHVRLPQIKLQTFDGNIDEWLSFRDLYTSLIHLKADLPDVEKFHYLKGCLAGEAKALVDPLSITRANYQIAWDALTKRYNDSKQLKRRQVQALFKLPKLIKESAAELQILLEGFERTIQTLDQLVQPTDYKDLLLINILSTRLDPATRRSWEEFSSMKEQDSIKDLTEFLQRRVKVLISLPKKSTDSRPEHQLPKRKSPNYRLSHNTIQSTEVRCVVCSESHLLYQCPEFQRMSISERDKVLHNNALCRNCFRRGHRAIDCPSRFVCRNCNGKHHTLVCFQLPANSNRYELPISRTAAVGGSIQSPEMPRSSHATPNVVSSNVSSNQTSSVLLATAIVFVEDEDGVQVPARALLDSGSECNFMTDRLSQQLKVQRQRLNVSVFGIGQSSMKVKQRVTVTVKSRVSGFSRRMQFLLLPKVTANLPTANVDMAGWEIPDGVELADPAFFSSKTVDLVLGIQYFFSFFNTGNEVTLGEGLPTLNESVFGWVVSGCVDGSHDNHCITCNMAIGLKLQCLSCEEIDYPSSYSPDEAQCEEQFVQSSLRGLDRQYSLALPKNEAAFERFDASMNVAYRRVQGLERRLLKDSEPRSQYTKFMEYLELGHTRKVDLCMDVHNKFRCFLPHHSVVKEESTTKKVQAVLDESCITSKGTSLYEALLAGPVIQDDLRSIILRSRARYIMVVADVEKLFRQIAISEDASLQSILWRTDPSEELHTYELTTVTYGTKPAPFLSIGTLKQLALVEQANYPIAPKTATEDVYMDDVSGCADSPDDALEHKKLLDKMTQNDRFRVRKWFSNFLLVYHDLSEDDLAIGKKERVQLDPDPSIPEIDPVEKLAKRRSLILLD